MRPMALHLASLYRINEEHIADQTILSPLQLRRRNFSQTERVLATRFRVRGPLSLPVDAYREEKILNTLTMSGDKGIQKND